MDNEFEVSDRHPFRFLFKLAAFTGLIYVTVRFLSQKKREFADLTESEARDKLIDKISSKVGDETANEIAGQVIPKLREKGLIKADPSGNTADSTDEKDRQDKVSEAVDTVVND